MSAEIQDKAEKIMKDLKDVLAPLKEEIKILKGQNQGIKNRI